MAEIRNDGYYNAVIGHGLRGRDPFASYNFGSRIDNPMIDWREADGLYTNNGLAQRIIDIPAEDAVRGKFEVEFQGENEHEEEKKICSILEDLAYNREMTTALSWDRLFGGSAMLILADDGGTLSEPLNMDRLRRVEKLAVYSAEDVTFSSAMIYDNPADPNYGRPEWYNVIGEWGNAFTVHESRLLLFYGGRISNYRRRMRNGWGGSVFEAIRQEMKHYSGGRDYAFMALGRLSQGILKLANMADLLMNDEGEKAVRMRLELIDMARHMMNTIAIDSTDDYDQKNMTLSGIREILEQYQFAICAATGIPATKLFGRSPAGQNATGESDLENYYNMVAAYQRNTLREPLMRLIDIISRCSDYDVSLPDKWTVEFKSLWNESEKEKAEVKKLEAEAKAKRADAIKILADAQLLDQMEARATLEKDDDYIIDRSLDNEISTPPME